MIVKVIWNFLKTIIVFPVRYWQKFFFKKPCLIKWLCSKTIQRGIIYSGKTLRNNLEYKDWFTNYINAAELLREEGELLMGIELMFMTIGLGVSFGSKHIAFWTFDNPTTAIYDSKISQILLRRKNPKTQDMIPFINAINNLSNNHVEFCGELTPKDIEKALFAFHKYYWSNSGVWLGLTSGIDFDCAVEWNSMMIY